MKTARYHFSRISPEVKRELVEEIVQWGLTIWHSTEDDLRGYWLEDKSYATVVYVLRADDGKLVGSTTLKYYHVDHDGKDTVIAKLGLGVDPKHRGNKFALRCMIRELLHLKLRYRFKPIYLFSTLIHPVTYKLCCDVLSDRLYPYFKSPDNVEMQRMVERLAEKFDVEKAESPYPFVYRERFSAIESAQASEYWRTNQRPEVQFYVQHCPTYHCSRDCLICLAPVDLTHMLPLMIRTLVRNRMDRWRGRKPKFISSGAPEGGTGG